MVPEFFKRSMLTRQLWSFRREFMWIGIFSMIANLLMLTPTIYMLQLYARVLKSHNELTLLAITIFMIVFFLIMAFAEWLRSRLLVRTGVRLDEGLNSMVFDASFQAFLRQSGKNAVQTFGDLAAIRQFLTTNGVIAFFDIPWTPFYIAVMFLLHPLLGVLSIVFAAIQLGFTWFSNVSMQQEIVLAANAGGSSFGFLQGKLRNIEPVHAMGMTSNLRRRWSSMYDDFLARNGGTSDREHRLQSINKFYRYAMSSLSLAAGAILVIRGELQVGSMVAANVLMSKALQPLDLIILTWKPFVKARESFHRLEGLLEEFPERPKGVRRLQDPMGEITLQQLNVTVPGREEPLLKDVDVMIPAGKVTVIQGPTGSGKSTLARCIVGVWPGASGKVLIDGEPVESWDREQLGRNIGYLPQDIELLEGTFAENIARFTEIDSTKVIEAARRAGIHDLIVRFPEGYDTPIGVAGGFLSAGFRQRLGLARAMYGNPAIYVLDEPNANLDEIGEAALVEAVRTLKAEGRTVIMISHRGGIQATADLVMLMDAGRVVRLGTRQEVLGS